MISLTRAAVAGAVAESDEELDKVSIFLRRLMPVVSGNTRHPIQALVRWVCGVLQSKKSLEVYGQDLRDFLTRSGLRFSRLAPWASVLSGGNCAAVHQQLAERSL